jgi:hypothetical protein
MHRTIRLWLALLAAFWLTRAVVGALLAGRLEQGFPTQLELVAIPALQAVALAWATRGPGPAQLLLPWRAAWGWWPLRVALALDAAALTAAWLPAAFGGAALPSWLAPSVLRSLPGWMTAANLAAGAAVLVVPLRRPGWGNGDRLALAALATAALAAAALAAAAAQRREWPAALLGLIASLAQPAARRATAYGVAAAACLLLLLRSATALRGRNRAAALALDWAIGLLLAAAGAAILAAALQPGPAAANWNHAAITLAGLGAASLLAASALLTHPGTGTRTGSAAATAEDLSEPLPAGAMTRSGLHGGPS